MLKAKYGFLPADAVALAAPAAAAAPTLAANLAAPAVVRGLKVSTLRETIPFSRILMIDERLHPADSV